MPIPAFDDAGLLPLGIHDCSLEEVRTRLGSFQTSDRRSRLFEKLQDFLHEVAIVKFVTEVIVNGSFVTTKPEPNDIDLIIALSPTHDFSGELRPFEYNVLSRRQVRRRFGLDVLVATKDSASYAEYVGFFQQFRGNPTRRKGVLRVYP